MGGVTGIPDLRASEESPRRRLPARGPGLPGFYDAIDVDVSTLNIVAAIVSCPRAGPKYSRAGEPSSYRHSCMEFLF